MLLPGRWIHICQAIDFNTMNPVTVVNGVNRIMADAYAEFYNVSGPIGRIETLKDNFIIGLMGEGGNWFGK